MMLWARNACRGFRKIPKIFFSQRSVHDVVSKEDVQKFKACGAVCLRGIFENEWIEKVERGVQEAVRSPSERSEALEGGPSGATYYNDHNNWRRIREFEDFVFNSPAGEIVGKLMESQKALFYHEHVFLKDVGNDRTAPWHQDQPYYPVEGKQACSIWLPLTPVSNDACIKYVKGSHEWGQWFYPRKFETKNKYENEGTTCNGHREYFEAPDIDGEQDKYELLSWDLQPGDCVVFHMLTLHGAPKRTDTTGRRVMVTRWLGDDARLGSRAWDLSPPYNGNLSPGDALHPTDEFPLVWSSPPPS